MTKTAFVYDKWLSSLGGGEVVACTIAATLRDLGYKTTFIAGQLVSTDTIFQKLNIDLKGIDFVQAFNDETKIKNITQNADLFVNASFWDYTLSSAKKQFYYTSFPGKPEHHSLKKIVKNILLKFLSNLLIPVEKLSERQFVFYSLTPNRHYRIQFYVSLDEFSKSFLETIDYTLENAKIISQKTTINHFKNQILFDIGYIANSNSALFTIKDESDNNHYQIKSLFLNSKLSKLSSFLRSGNFPDLQNRIRQFDLVLANSQYTARWIKNYWGVDSEVLYPPVNPIKTQLKTKKKNQICSVGRFFTLGHGKKQEVMIEAFKKMCDNGLKGWELHLAGGLGNEPTSLAYAEFLKDLTKGYPVFLHFNKPRKFIEELYLSSKIYWHAAGFDEDSQQHPIKFEHFGIAPVEAITADCVPVLYNGGGLPEIIKTLNLGSDHLFETIDDLVKKTQNIIKKDTFLPSNTQKIFESYFSVDSFRKQLNRLLQSI